MSSRLTDQATFLSNKINFLLDATLGLINLQQNQIIKIFSVAAVVFLPPTLVASIYGMNFSTCRSSSGSFGYPWAIGIMVPPRFCRTTISSAADGCNTRSR